MKKIVLMLFLAITLLPGLVSCGIPETQVNILPPRFDSIEDFIDALKTPEKYEEFDYKSITCYYRPKNLPEGAMLQYITAGKDSIQLVYTLDSDKKSKDRAKLLTLSWFRTCDNADTFIEFEMGKRNGKEIKLKDGIEGTKYVADYTFSESKALNSKYWPAWYLNWVQDGECFIGWVPYSIPEADIAKYLEMEKVVIE